MGASTKHPTTPFNAFSSLGLALLGTTCCALPVVLVLLGAGGAVASLVSALPWLAALSAHKAWLFGATAAVLTYSWWHLGGVAASCPLEEGRKLRGQRRLLWISTVMLAVSMAAAYGAAPLARWLESR